MEDYMEDYMEDHMEDHMDTEVNSNKSATTWTEMTVAQYLNLYYKYAEPP